MRVHLFVEENRRWKTNTRSQKQMAQYRPYSNRLFQGLLSILASKGVTLTPGRPAVPNRKGPPKSLILLCSFLPFPDPFPKTWKVGGVSPSILTTKKTCYQKIYHALTPNFIPRFLGRSRTSHASGQSTPATVTVSVKCFNKGWRLLAGETPRPGWLLGSTSSQDGRR